MNISSQISRNQSGIALIIFLTVIVLGAATFLVSKANDSRFQTAINAQKQTNTALRQAKEALLGFAAVYAKTHSNQPQGYLPCPDLNGNGSSDMLGTSCGSEGKSMLGRFPWRTLGLPPLRDGNGDCLWYAVSGSYKDKTYLSPTRKFPLTSDTPGLFVVENANGDKIAGGTCDLSVCTPEETESNGAKQAIVIIFSPGKILDGQSRTVTANNANICGSTDSSDNINKANNYLDSFKINSSYTINNYNGTKSTLIAETNSIFIKTPITYNTNKKVVFNDRLMLITRQDFEHVYERMDFWVAKKVSKCLEKVSGSNYQDYFLNDVFLKAIGDLETPEAGSYRAEHSTEIQNFIDNKIISCKADCDSTLNTCNSKAQECNDIGLCETECSNDNITCKSVTDGCDSDATRTTYRKRAISVEERFPWVASINDDNCFNVGYQDSSYKNVCQPTIDKRFGRIPNIPNNIDNGMLKQWTSSLNCFKSFWWDKWKENVFYIVNKDYTPDVETHFWVRLSESTTYAKIDESKRDEWDSTPPTPPIERWMSVIPVPTPPVDEILQLNDNDINKFVILVSGQILNDQTRAKNSDKMNIDNYLDEDNLFYFKDYLINEKCYVDPDMPPSTLPNCIFERKKTYSDFNDIVCKDYQDDCNIPK